jgi:hypothetical protein
MRILLLIIFFLQSFVSHAQNFLWLEKQNYFLGEEVYFQQIIEDESIDNFLAIGLYNPVNQKIESFYYFPSQEAKIIQSSFRVPESISSGEYVLFSVEKESKKITYAPVFLLHSKLLELYFQLKLNLQVELIDLEAIQNLAPDVFVEEMFYSNEGKQFIANFPDGLAYPMHYYSFNPTPLASQNRQLNEIDTLSILEISNENEGSALYEVFWRAELFQNFTLAPGENFILDLKQLPIGNLIIRQGQAAADFFNPIYIDSLDVPTQSIKIKPGETQKIGLPKVINPHTDSGGTFLFGSWFKGAIAESESPTRKASQTSVASSTSKVLKVAVKATKEEAEHEISNSIFYINAEGVQFELPLQTNFVDFDWDSFISLGVAEGVFRLTQHHKHLAVVASSPWLEGFLPFVKQDLLEYQPYFLESWFRLFDQSFSFERELYLQSLEIVDLDEVVIQGLSDADFANAFDLHPFSPHWINSDFLCSLNGLNCTEGGANHRISIGSSLKASRRLPLHIYHDKVRPIEIERNRSIARNRQAMLAGAGRNQLDFSRVAASGFGVHQDARRLASNPNASLASGINYKWNVEDYLANQQIVSLAKENTFPGLKDDLTLDPSFHPQWFDYKNIDEVLVKAPMEIGHYDLVLHFYDYPSDELKRYSLKIEVGN